MAVQGKTHPVAEQSSPERNFAKEIQNEHEMKAYYEKKNEELNKILEKYAENKRDLQERIENYQKECKDLKDELFHLNKGCNISIIKSSKILKRSLNSSKRIREKSLSRLETKKILLKHDLSKYKKQEHSLASLLSELSSVSLAPIPNLSSNLRSYSQPKIRTPKSYLNPKSFYKIT